MAGEVKVFRRLNAFDFLCIAAVVLSACGFLLAKAQQAGVNKAIRGNHPIDIVIYMVGVKTKDTDLFKVGDTASLTIRNVPVQPPMKIKAVTHNAKEVAFLSPDGKSAISFPDPVNPIAHDFVVTVTDNADVTDDGYVVSGNKLKIGNSVELESFKYRIPGVVVDVFPSKQ
jgi:hypothetical protein